MRTLKRLVPVALFGTAVAMQACGSVTIEDQEPGPLNAGGGRAYPFKGVIRGTVLYQGPRPCSQNGHIIGNVPVLIFDARNPPPPSGLANTATNLTVISGDTLFATEPRSPGALSCPTGADVTVSAPFAVGPLDAGEYLIQAFYDRTGNFLPTFKFRNLPRAGDIGGGFIDTGDAAKLIDDHDKVITLSDGGIIRPQIPKQADANYQPIFLPIKIGVEGPVPADSVRGVPSFTMPKDGFIADNITIAIGAPLQRSRPYFYAEGVLPDGPSGGGQIIAPPVSSAPADAVTPTDGNPDGNTDYAPILTMTQDYQVYAQPTNPGLLLRPGVVDQIQASFPQLKLHWGVPDPELATATATDDPKLPFHFQIPQNSGINVWWNGTNTQLGKDPSENYVPEGLIQRLWPLVVLAKLKADPKHTLDPQGLAAQGSDLAEPIVIIQGITISQDSLFDTNQSPPDTFPNKSNLQEHVTVMLRPSALCIDPRHADRGGTLVTPHVVGPYPPAIADGRADHPLIDKSALLNSTQLKPLLSAFKEACLPVGRYGINMVYPTGQAWSTPNETGSCATAEGAPTAANRGVCSKQVRPILYSQGNRAVVEVVKAADGVCGGTIADVPPECSTLAKE